MVLPPLPKVKVAACHVSPVFLDTAATLKKAIGCITEAASNGARYIAFPETFIPGFPIWSGLAAPGFNHDLFVKLVKEAIYVDGPEMETLKAVCSSQKVFVQMGFNERSRQSIGCLWNSTVLISDEGKILNHHRKIVPTFYEKLTWANGDGAGLRVVDTSIGRLGALICGENGNALARYALHAQAEQIHVSLWPPTYHYKAPGLPGDFNIAAGAKIRAMAHSFEGKCFGIVVGSPIGNAKEYLIARDPECERFFTGTIYTNSLFIDPSGKQIGEERSGEDEGFCYADFDLEECIELKQLHDFTGYYQRYDIFDLRIKRQRQEPVAWEDGDNLDRCAWVNIGKEDVPR